MARSAESSSIEVRDRDALILLGLLESRVMTLSHIATLHFDGKSEAAKKRVQKLKAAQLVCERPRKPRDPSILFLAKRGFEYLASNNQLGHYPPMTWASLAKRVHVSELTLPHELQIMDVKAALCAAITKTDRLRVTEFSTWPVLYRFNVVEPGAGEVRSVEPDAFVRIEQDLSDTEGLDHAFFLELDRSHETVERVVQQAVRYRAFYATGGYARRHGAPAEAYANFPFRVLMVFKSAQRRDNIAERLLQLSPPILSQTWLTTYAEVIQSPLGAIWMEPRDFRQRSQVESFGIQDIDKPPKRRLFQEGS